MAESNKSDDKKPCDDAAGKGEAEGPRRGRAETEVDICAVVPFDELLDGKTLTPTQRREYVRRLRAQGKTRAEIGARLKISARQVSRDLKIIRETAAEVFNPDNIASIVVELDTRARDRVSRLYQAYDELVAIEKEGAKMPARSRARMVSAKARIIEALGREDDRLVQRLEALGIHYSDLEKMADLATDDVEKATGLSREKLAEVDELLADIGKLEDKK
jgi:hypothetical protein